MDLVQSWETHRFDDHSEWGTYRFDDHSGVKPGDVSFHGDSLSARLTRSKTLGSDRSVGSRQILIHACCFIERREWLQEGWRVLCLAADFDRDYLLPSPTTNCNGCLPSELKYDTAYAMQNRVLYSLRKEGNAVFTRVSTSFWTPHSARAFFCRAARTLFGCQRKNEIFFGGWSARGSETDSRVAVRFISNLQLLVIWPLIEKPNADPLAEEETILQFESFMCEKGVGPEERAKCFNSLAKTQSRFLFLVLQSWWWEKWDPRIPLKLFLTLNISLKWFMTNQERTSVSKARTIPRKCVIMPDVCWNPDTMYLLLVVVRPGYYISWKTAT